MNNNESGLETVLLWAFGLFLAAAIALEGWLSVATRIACGQWRLYAPGEIFEGFSSGLDFTGGGECGPGAEVVIGAGIGLVVLVVILVVAVVMIWLWWKESDLRFIRQLRERDGLAKGGEVRKKAGTKALGKRAKSIRPGLERPRLEDVGRKLGVSHREVVWMSLEDSVVVLGPPRSGKGFYLAISAILDSPGSVITTSTRGDNVAATIQLREKIGPCTVFDPQGLSGVKSTLKWTPYHGCEAPQVATKRAQVLIGASGMGKSSNNAEWAQQSEIILAYLLHAAALGSVRVGEFAQWGQSAVLADRAVEILENHPSATPGWAQNLKAEVESDAKTRASKWMGVMGATSALNVPGVAEALDPSPGEPVLDPEEFIRSKGTLYLLGSKSGGGAIAPFLIALMDEIVETARELAFTMPGNRLDPPMSLILDEIANMAPWGSLPQIMADGGGVGISPMVFFQSPAQARGQWGADEAQALIDSAILQIQLGGSNNDTELKRFVELAGTREVKEKSRSWSSQGKTNSEQSREKQVFTVSELRRLPSGYGLLLNRNARPVLMKMTRWIDRKDAKQIKASMGYFRAMMERGKTAEVPAGGELGGDITGPEDRTGSA